MFTATTVWCKNGIKFKIVDGGGVDQFHSFYCMYLDKFGLQIYSYVLVGEARPLYHDNMYTDLSRLLNITGHISQRISFFRGLPLIALQL